MRKVIHKCSAASFLFCIFCLFVFLQRELLHVKVILFGVFEEAETVKETLEGLPYLGKNSEREGLGRAQVRDCELRQTWTLHLHRIT